MVPLEAPCAGGHYLKRSASAWRKCTNDCNPGKKKVTFAAYAPLETREIEEAGGTTNSRSMATWGRGLRGRVAGRDDGDWKAFRCDHGGVNGFNIDKIMWYNVVTHEHRWKQPSFEELQDMAREWSYALHEEVQNIAHKHTVLSMWRHTAVEIVHSLVHPARWAGEEPAIETPSSRSELCSQRADEALLSMRADAAKEHGPPPSEPGLWRSCLPAARPLRSMLAYAKLRRPQTSLCDHRNPKNGTHVECPWSSDTAHPVWKKETRAANNTKVSKLPADAECGPTHPPTSTNTERRIPTPLCALNGGCRYGAARSLDGRSSTAECCTSWRGDGAAGAQGSPLSASICPPSSAARCV